MCDCEQVRDSNHFAGWDDYDHFRKALRASTEFTDVPVLAPFSNVGLTEEWYRCNRCSKVWRLVEPDPPFKGLWERVD